MYPGTVAPADRKKQPPAGWCGEPGRVVQADGRVLGVLVVRPRDSEILECPIGEISHEEPANFTAARRGVTSP